MKTPSMLRTPRGALTVLLLGIGSASLLVVVLFTWAWHAFPLPADFLHSGAPGAIVLDREGGVLLDVVGSDEQRRLSIGIEQAGPWIPNAVIAAEDLAFHEHGGIDVSAIIGALRDNLRAGRVVRGGSTITMQVAGLRLNHPRTYAGKAIEAFRALQIEAAHDKDRILEGWLNSAPFGGNLVGIETASRAWFGKPANACSLAEAALLAALPNAPERLRPDRYPEAASARRKLILQRMLDAGFIDEEQYEQAEQEVILIRRRDPVPNTMHAGWLAIERSGRGRVIETTIDHELQAILEDLTRAHASRLPEYLDTAIVLVELETSSIRALVGSSDPEDPRDGQVNGTRALRSPGSTLKPFVYALAFDQHRLAPDSIVHDAPLELDGWRPRNIDHEYMGTMTAAEALRTSRNTPALRIARDLGLSPVIARLRRCGIEIPPQANDHSGLSLLVGGVEVRPIELAEAYATLARGGIHRPLRLLETDGAPERRVFSREACTAIESSLSPADGFEQTALPFLAAKTGTSSGLRDALAAGWNGRYAAVVWVGRFDGGPDPSLIGSSSALPLLRSILMHPRIVTTRPHREHAEWVVKDQVAGVQPPRIPAILEPRDGDTLVATDGHAHARMLVRSATDDPVLLLDGVPIKPGSIELPLGTHELRVFEGTRPPHAITFEVVAPSSPTDPG